MISSEIEKCIVKYLSGTISNHELAQLEDWIKIDDHKDIFKEYIELHHSFNSQLVKNKKQNFIDSESRRINTKTRKLIPYELLKYTAILVIALGSAYFLYQRNPTSKDLIASSDQITLQFGNGKTEIINENTSKEILDAEGRKIGVQQENKIVYTKSKKTSSEIIFNQLTVPYGKQFELVLSDGTMIILNSGTSIKYPSQFAENQKREVTLIGEAFFNVAKDTKHPFVVNAHQLKVRVLGTQFNVSAYPEETNISTVLVEGSVGLYNDQNYNSETATLLEPGFKGVYNEKKQTILKEEVDTRIYTSWRSGELIFRNIPFKNIIKRLERNYNISIDNKNIDLNEQYFNASFNAKESVEKILNTFVKSYPFNYQIINNKIIIN